ncbi:hypothetical protein CDD83_9911 [Cordyceps sp. RAO-2017]|nr:hypothetical protein CDD83_9911 [Cordyceps sp. RAO-2017]
MPYLHWEVEKRLMRMSNIVQEQTAARQSKSEIRKLRPKRRPKLLEMANDRRMQLRRLQPGSRRKVGQWRPTSALAKYLWLAAKMFEIIDEIADERLVTQNLDTKAPIHIRRTLDQFYHWTTADTTDQDHNQVVCRKTRSGIDPRATSRLVVVDQLWMWILDENTILTCFPRRWGRNKPDPSAVHKGIRQTIGELVKREHETWCIYDLALIIIDECSRVFFDRTAPLDQRPEVVAIFGAAISDVAEQKTMAYEAFGEAVTGMNKQESAHSNNEDLLRKSLNINFEWSVLIDAQHVIDELQIMQEVFTQQLAVNWSTISR